MIKNVNKILNLLIYIKRKTHTFDNICQDKLFKLKKIGEIIRERREQKGILLRQLAAKLDIDNAILSKIERGERKPKRELILKLADILEINREELLIQYLSDNIAYEIADEEVASRTLKLAEKKIHYLKLSKNGKV